MATDEAEGIARSEDTSGNTGTIASRWIPLALRVHARQETIWIMYGAIMGGNEADDGTWLNVYFHGAAPWKGDIQEGSFRMSVKGARLGLISQDIASGLRMTLKIGVDTTGEDMPEVTSIDIEPVEIEMQ